MAQNLVWTSLNKVIEPMLKWWPVNKLRGIALKNIMEQIYYEDETSKYICVCPINKVIRINAGVLFCLLFTKGSNFIFYYVSKVWLSYLVLALSKLFLWT